MPISERKPTAMKQRASEKLAAIPEEDDAKDAKVMAPPTTTITPPNAPQQPHAERSSPPLTDTLKRLITWDVVYEKNFYKYFFSCVYGLAIISYLISTLMDNATYNISTFLFHRMMGGIYFIGFYSIQVQILDAKKAKSRVPTVFWYKQTDSFILLVCYTGLASSFLYMINILPTLMQMICFIAFLSFKTVGREFFALQFDNLLLDTSIWAILLPPIRIIPFLEIPTSNFYNRSILWLLRWLLFRLMVGSGLCKVSSGDKTWRNGTALMYHYWSQPMPNWISYYANALPEKLQKFSCYYHFFVELAAPFGAFFPILFIPKAVRFSLDPLAHTAVHALNWGVCNLLVAGLVGFVLMLSLVAFSQVARGNMEIPEIIYKIQSRLSRFGLMNYYGLFARMTTTRKEVIIEGSADGKTWVEYELYYKPGDVKRRPPFVIGHLPRLDWRIWFCQFTHFNSFLPGWFDIFLMKILEGSPQVLELVKHNPFPNHPPRFLRAVIYDYNFPDKEKRKEGYWWVRTNKKLWWPPCTLHNGKILYLR